MTMTGRRKLEQCSATSQRSGERCRAKALPGAEVCRQHGGNLPAVAAAADKRAALAEVERMTERLGVITNPEDPFEGAAAAMRQLRHMAQDTGTAVAALTANGTLRYEHEKAGEQIRGEVVIWQRVVKDMADLSLAIIRAGMDAKLAEISEKQGEDFVSFVRSVLHQFGIDFADPAVNEVVVALFERTIRGDGQAVVPAAIEAPRAPALTPVCEMGMHEKCRAYMPVDDRPVPPWPQRCPCQCHEPGRNLRREWESQD
jgi:hypothetical protein